MKYLKGFTLIELMIVVAIVGILAAVAMPVYQSHIAKTQAAEGVVLLKGLKSAVSDYYSVKGTLPSIADINAVVRGRYVREVTGGGGSVADYSVLFKSAGSVSASLADQSITMSLVTADNSFVWDCFTMPASIQPEICH